MLACEVCNSWPVRSRSLVKPWIRHPLPACAHPRAVACQRQRPGSDIASLCTNRCCVYKCSSHRVRCAVVASPTAGVPMQSPAANREAGAGRCHTSARHLSEAALFSNNRGQRVSADILLLREHAIVRGLPAGVVPSCVSPSLPPGLTFSHSFLRSSS